MQKNIVCVDLCFQHAETIEIANAIAARYDAGICKHKYEHPGVLEIIKIGVDTVNERNSLARSDARLEEMKSNNRTQLVTIVDAVIGSMQNNAMVGNGEYSPSLTEAMGMGGGQIPMIVEKTRCGVQDDNLTMENKLIYDDYNSVICEDQNSIPTLTTNCGASATRNGMKVIELNDITEVKKFVDPRYHDFVYDVDGEYWLILIRKLMPIECWRLMGFDDEDFERAAEVNSNSQLYKQAGNSIVVNVLEAIFKEMID